MKQRKRRKSESVPASETSGYYCGLCPFESDAPALLLDHLRDEHGCDRERLRNLSGQTLWSLDGEDWYQNTTEWKLDGRCVMGRVTTGKRASDDPMRAKR